MEKRTVLITGCSSGLGLELVKQFSQNFGWIIFAAVRSVKTPGFLPDVIKNINENKKSSVIMIELDVSSQESIGNAVEKIISQEKKIDVVINNAAVVVAGFCETVKEEEMKHIFDINVFGVVRLLQAVLPHMRERKSGHIIAVSSISAMGCPTGLGFYGASKCALEGILQAEASILEKWNIKLTMFQCGTFKTETPHMAEKVTIGSRANYPMKGQDFYKQHIVAKKGTYMQLVSLVDLTAENVAEQLYHIISKKGSFENFQIQTPGEAEDYAEKYFVDPTGNNYLNKEKEQTTYFLSISKQ